MSRRLRADPRSKNALAKACRKSFQSYFDQLPEAIRLKQQSIRQKIQDDPKGVLEIISPVRSLEPYQRLADSMVNALPGLPSEIVRAVALAWSPAALEVRRWLRGDDLPETERDRLQLGDRHPNPEDVIKVIATLLQLVSIPLIICCDQIEAVLKDEKGPINFSNDLMGILQAVPNLLIIISCLEDKWPVLQGAAQQSFRGRFYPELKLSNLSAPQAVELVQRRMRVWQHPRSDKYPTFPFRLEAINNFADQAPRAPGSWSRSAKRQSTHI